MSYIFFQLYKNSINRNYSKPREIAFRIVGYESERGTFEMRKGSMLRIIQDNVLDFTTLSSAR